MSDIAKTMVSDIKEKRGRGMKVGVVGAAGYAGIQAVAILAEHPNFELVAIASEANEGAELCEVYPTFLNAQHGVRHCKFIKTSDMLSLNLDAVFLAVPHKASLEITPKFLEAGVSVIDLSADYRLRDPYLYEKWYGVRHSSPELLESRIFGLPELFPIEGEVSKPALVACAGCYVTASSLAAKPFVESEFFNQSLTPVIDAISGYTGAGKNPGSKGLLVNAAENVSAYGVTHHRHTPEIEQILGTSVVFTPHLAPTKRGILSTVTIKTEGSLTPEKIHSIYAQFYNGCEFVKVLPLGQFPQTSNVIGTNFAHIGVAYDEEKQVSIAICAIDNLVKGAAGQAAQCANLVFGLPENAGLSRISLPV